MQRRWEKAQHLRKKRGIALDAPINARFRRRDLTALEADEKVNHNKTSSGYTESTSSSTLFASYKNSSCILAPEVTFGPYWVEGEYYRSNVRDGQAGVPIHLEYQYIDVNTCDTPTSDLYIEHWSANATGVYSGVVASGNGNSNDLTNLNKTFLRGVTKVTDGVGAFDAIFPGHYEGRATHIHLITHIGGTVYSNNTYKGSNVAHVGQLFFDEELKTAVEKTSPYSTNTQAYTSNDEDMWAPYEAENGYDPFPDWAYLSNDISDGLLMWISVGVNMSASYTVTPAATLTANGGV
ncbi:aromatic compound dioxygenase, partial [Myriangium duriaei CBS 260.36]